MSKFKIGVLADAFKLGFKGDIEKAREVGAEAVQVYAVSGEMAPENLTAADIAEKKQILADNGMKVSALCGDPGGQGFTNKEMNVERIAMSKRVVDLGLELGTNIVTTHVGVVPCEQNDTFKIMQEACNELAEYANEKGAFFAIETGPETAETLKAFLDSLSSKGVAVNLDPANFVMVTGDDPVKAVYTLKDYIVHTHAKDGRRFQPVDPKVLYGALAHDAIPDWAEYFAELPLGEGDVDWDNYLKALEEIGFNGYLTIEREVGANPTADIEMAVKFLADKISKM